VIRSNISRTVVVSIPGITLLRYHHLIRLFLSTTKKCQVATKTKSEDFLKL